MADTVISIGFKPENMDSILGELKKTLSGLEGIADKVDITGGFKKQLKELQTDLKVTKKSIETNLNKLSTGKVDVSTFENFEKEINNTVNSLKLKIENLEQILKSFGVQLNGIDASGLGNSLQNTHNQFNLFQEDTIRSTKLLKQLITLLNESNVRVKFGDNKDVHTLQKELLSLSNIQEQISNTSNVKKFKEFSYDDFKTEIQNTLDSVDELENKLDELEINNVNGQHDNEISNIENQIKQLQIHIYELGNAYKKLNNSDELFREVGISFEYYSNEINAYKEEISDAIEDIQNKIALKQSANASNELIEATKFEAKNGKILVPIELNTTSFDFKKQVFDIITQAEAAIKPIEVEIQAKYKYRAWGKKEDEDTENKSDIEKGVENELHAALEYTKKQAKATVNALIEEFRSNKKEFKITPEIDISKEEVDKIQDKLNNASKNLKLENLKNLSESMKGLLDDDLITRWKDDFITAIEQVVNKIESAQNILKTFSDTTPKKETTNKEHLTGTFYHGSKLKWDSDFDISKNKTSQLGQAAYFTSNTENVIKFGKAQIKQLEVDLKKCFILTNDYVSSVSDIYKAMGTTAKENATANDVINDIRKFTKNEDQAVLFRQRMLEMGYQGIFAEKGLANKNADELAIYDEALLKTLKTVSANDIKGISSNISIGDIDTSNLEEGATNAKSLLSVIEDLHQTINTFNGGSIKIETEGLSEITTKIKDLIDSFELLAKSFKENIDIASISNANDKIITELKTNLEGLGNNISTNVSNSLNELKNIFKTGLISDESLNKLSDGMKSSINVDIIEEWKNSFINAINQISNKLDELFDTTTENQFYKTMKEWSEADSIMREHRVGRKSQNGMNTINDPSAYGALERTVYVNTSTGKTSNPFAIDQTASVSKDIMQALKQAAGVSKIGDAFDATVHSHPLFKIEELRWKKKTDYRDVVPDTKNLKLVLDNAFKNVIKGTFVDEKNINSGKLISNIIDESWGKEGDLNAGYVKDILMNKISNFINENFENQSIDKKNNIINDIYKSLFSEFNRYINTEAKNKGLIGLTELKQKGSDLVFSKGDMRSYYSDLINENIKKTIVQSNEKMAELDLSSLPKDTIKKILEDYINQLSETLEKEKSQYKLADTYDFDKRSEISHDLLSQIITKHTGKDASEFLKVYDLNNLDINTIALSENQVQIEKFIEILEKLDSTISSFNGENNINFNLSGLDKTEESLHEIISLLHKAFNISTSEDITAQWDNVQKSFDNADKIKDGSITSSSKKLKVFFEEYQKYIDMGGTNLFSDLEMGDNTKIIEKNLTKLENKYKDFLSISTNNNIDNPVVDVKIESQTEEVLSKLKTTLTGDWIISLHNLSDVFSNLNIEKDVAQNIQALAKAIVKLKESLSNIDSDGLTFISSIKELVEKTEGLKDLITILKSTKKDIEKANNVAESDKSIVNKDYFDSNVISMRDSATQTLSDKYSDVKMVEITRSEKGLVTLTAAIKDADGAWKKFTGNIDSEGKLSTSGITELSKTKMNELEQLDKDSYNPDDFLTVSSETIGFMTDEWNQVTASIIDYKEELGNVQDVTMQMQKNKKTGERMISYTVKGDNGNSLIVGANGDVLKANIGISNAATESKKSYDKEIKLLEQINKLKIKNVEADLKGDNASKAKNDEEIKRLEALVEEEKQFRKDKKLETSDGNNKINDVESSLKDEYTSKKRGLENAQAAKEKEQQNKEISTAAYDEQIRCLEEINRLRIENKNAPLLTVEANNAEIQRLQETINLLQEVLQYEGLISEEQEKRLSKASEKLDDEYNKSYSKDYKKTIDEITKVETRIQQLKAAESNNVLTSSERKELDKLIDRKRQLSEVIENTINLTEAEQRLNEQYYTFAEKKTEMQLRNVEYSSVDMDANRNSNVVAKANESLQNLKNKGIYGLQDEINSAEQAISDLTMEFTRGSISAEKYEQEVQKLLKPLHKVQTVLGENMTQEEGETAVDEYIENFVNSIGGRNLEVESSELDYSTGIMRTTASFIDAEGHASQLVTSLNLVNGQLTQVVETGEKTSLLSKMFDGFKKGLVNVAQYIAGFEVFDFLKEIFQEGVQYVIDFDTALTEMRKVSDESVSSLKNFQAGSFDMANEVGTTALQIQQSTADFMRLGETLDEAAESAKVANKLMAVSEFEGIEEATEALVAMKAAYSDIDQNVIVDKLNQVGNNFSISTDGLASALQRSASALTTAGNDIDASIALITAGNQVVQDPESVGAGIRTIALRLTGKIRCPNT